MLWRYWQELPNLIRFIVQHFLIGVALGWASGLMVIWYDIGGVGSLLARYDSPALTALFFAKGGLYFCTFATSVAIMNMGGEESGGKRPRSNLFAETLFAAFGDSKPDRPLELRPLPQRAGDEMSSVPRSRGRASG